MEKFKTGLVDTAAIISRVRHLFSGQPELVMGFDVFLPAGHKITRNGPTEQKLQADIPAGAGVARNRPRWGGVNSRRLAADLAAEGLTPMGGATVKPEPTHTRLHRNSGVKDMAVETKARMKREEDEFEKVWPKPVPIPAAEMTPALQRLAELGVRHEIAIDMVKFLATRHRIHKQKLAGKYDDASLAPLLGNEQKLSILRNKSFCNIARILDRVSAYTVAEIIRPCALTKDLASMLFNLIIMRAYVNDATRFAFLGMQDHTIFDADVFVAKIKRCLVLSGRDEIQDISNSAYNVGTFSKYRRPQDVGGKGVKKHSAAAFIAGVAKQIPQALAAMLHKPSADKTFDILQRVLGVATFPAYNITLDLGYYHRGLCDENEFDYIGPGAKPAVHFLQRDPYKWEWASVRSAPKPGTEVRLGQRVGTVERGGEYDTNISVRWADTGKGETVDLYADAVEHRRMKAPRQHSDEVYGGVMRALQAAVPDLCRVAGLDASVEFEGLPMAQLPCGTMGLNLQAVEGGLCEYRKYVTEQPKFAVLCGKNRPRSGLHYSARSDTAQIEYRQWLQVVHAAVLGNWFVDRTALHIWQQLLDARSNNICLLKVLKAGNFRTSSWSAASQLGEIVDALECILVQVERIIPQQPGYQVYLARMEAASGRGVLKKGAGAGRCRAAKTARLVCKGPKPNGLQRRGRPLGRPAANTGKLMARKEPPRDARDVAAIVGCRTRKNTLSYWVRWSDPASKDTWIAAADMKAVAEHVQAFEHGRMLRKSAAVQHLQTQRLNFEGKSQRKRAAPISDADFMRTSLEKLFKDCSMLTGTNGRDRTALFKELPSKKDYPDYYFQIQEPIAILCIREKLDQSQYQDIAAAAEDMRLMCNNAQHYNMEGSECHTDAGLLQARVGKRLKLLAGDANRRRRIASASRSPALGGASSQVQTQVRQLQAHMKVLIAQAKAAIRTGDDIWAQQFQQALLHHNRELKRLRAATNTPSTVGDTGEDAAHLRECLHGLHSQCIGLKDGDRDQTWLFQELPSKIDYPDYYDAIKNPISFACIREKIEQGQYQDVDAAAVDILLICSNAQEYNIENSECYSDAGALREKATKRLRAMKVCIGKRRLAQGRKQKTEAGRASAVSTASRGPTAEELPPEGWSTAVDPTSGGTYYINRRILSASWHRPTATAPAVANQTATAAKRRLPPTVSKQRTSPRGDGAVCSKGTSGCNGCTGTATKTTDPATGKTKSIQVGRKQHSQQCKAKTPARLASLKTGNALHGAKQLKGQRLLFTEWLKILTLTVFSVTVNAPFFGGWNEQTGNLNPLSYGQELSLAPCAAVLY
jgi:hypothetical protein